MKYSASLNVSINSICCLDFLLMFLLFFVVISGAKVSHLIENAKRIMYFFEVRFIVFAYGESFRIFVSKYIH